MYLEKIELQGFKSFANKTSLEFGKGITAVVGPNGSGKSNVADAIRWVLGEQSLKLIRGKRAEDVIFAGSDRKTRLGAAEISLYLNNEDGAAPIDFSELVITRRVYRDGTGEYLVNKRLVRLQDIQMLLARANFGQRSYSVIGQGMVDTILLTSPLERKQFFDEAAGVRQYQLKREQAITKLDRTRENLQQAEVLMQEIEPRLRSLTRQMRRLERRSEVERELTELQVRYYRGLLQDLRRQLAASNERLVTLERSRTERERRVAALNAKLQEFEQERSRSEAFAALQRQFERAQADKGVLLAEEAVLKGQRDASFAQQGRGNVVWVEKQQVALKQQVADLEAEHTELVSAMGAEQVTVSALEAEAAEKQQTYAALEAELARANHSLQQDAVSLPQIQNEFADVASFQEAFLGELRAATSIEVIAALQKKGQELAERTTRFARNLDRVGQSVGARQVLELQAKLQAVAREREQFLQSLNEHTLSIRIKREKQLFIESNLERLRSDLERLDRELARSRAETKDEVTATLHEQSNALAEKIKTVDERLKAITAAVQQFNVSETQKRDEMFRLQRELREAQDRLNEASTPVNEIRVELARLETRLQDAEREIREEVKELAWPQVFESSEAASAPPPEQQEEMQRLKHQLTLIGGIDEGVEHEYRETDERYRFLKTQYDDLIKASAQLEQGIAELDRTIKERFDEAFVKINEEFGKYFKTLFRGGSAKLVLLREEVQEETENLREDNDAGTEAEDEAEEGRDQTRRTGQKVITGIDIQATPPGKRLKGIAMLSGGERALTSIALICAIISNNPMPFGVLDEVDAALDEANSQRFAAILELLAKKTQFVTITHNRATMEKANILYGVTMGDDGVSKLLSVKLEEAEHVIKKYGNR